MAAGHYGKKSTFVFNYQSDALSYSDQSERSGGRSGISTAKSSTVILANGVPIIFCFAMASGVLLYSTATLRIALRILSVTGLSTLEHDWLQNSPRLRCSLLQVGHSFNLYWPLIAHGFSLVYYRSVTTYLYTGYTIVIHRFYYYYLWILYCGTIWYIMT